MALTGDRDLLEHQVSLEILAGMVSWVLLVAVEPQETQETSDDQAVRD